MSVDNQAAGTEPPRRLTWLVAPLFVFLAVAAMFAFALRSGDPSRLPSALIGKPVPKSEFASVEGLVEGAQPVAGFTSADLAKGELSIVNFWASWCRECVEEHPLLTELSQKSGVAVYGVNYKDNAEAARRYLGRYGNPYRAVGTDAAGRAAIDWGVYGMPETFLINGRGEFVYKYVGPITAEALTTKILPAIEKERARASLAPK